MFDLVKASSMVRVVPTASSCLRVFTASPPHQGIHSDLPHAERHAVLAAIALIVPSGRRDGPGVTSASRWGRCRSCSPSSMALGWPTSVTHRDVLCGGIRCRTLAAGCFAHRLTVAVHIALVSEVFAERQVAAKGGHVPAFRVCGGLNRRRRGGDDGFRRRQKPRGSRRSTRQLRRRFFVAPVRAGKLCDRASPMDHGARAGQVPVAH